MKKRFSWSPPTVGHDFSCPILKTLKALKIKIRVTSQERIAVVKARTDDGCCNHIGCGNVKGPPDVAECTKMKITSSANFRNMVSEGKLSIECHTNNFYRRSRGYRKTSNKKMRLKGISRVKLRASASPYNLRLGRIKT